MKGRLTLTLTTLAGILLSACNSPQKKEETLFTKLSAEQTHVTFNNINAENEQINIFTYEYLYNGAGVALGDINNDGLVDIYFSSNNLENKLYLNKGNFEFEDITATSGAGCKPGWKTGVSMIDINADGWLDIYVCRSADGNPQNRKNSLLINNGNMTFTDKAKEFGLDDDSYSTQAAFFDYDRDGDLDVFLLNHSLLSISNSFNISNLNPKLRYPYVGNRFLRNDNGHFVDISDAMGIYGPSSTYGLGIGVADINNDGWQDVYVSNDYVDNDKLYLNDHGKQFINATDSLLSHVSQFSMGMDMADINEDGLMDILTLDMLPEDNKRQKLLFGPDRYDVFTASVRNGYYYQYMRNMLHLNNGDGTFSEIGQLAGVSNTDWSWSALFADYDNDGKQDLFVSNGYKRDFTNNDFLKYRADQEIKSRGGKKDSFTEMIKKIPSNKVSNYAYKNSGNLHFEDVGAKWGLSDKMLTNGAAYADLDNDGDLDLVTNNIDELASIYRNNLKTSPENNFLKVKLIGSDSNRMGLGSRVTLYTEGKILIRDCQVIHGFQSAVDATVHFGLGATKTVDSLVVHWPRGESQSIIHPSLDTLLEVKQSEAVRKPEAKILPQPTLLVEDKTALNFVHQENDYIDFKTQALLPRMYSTQGPAMASADVNGDGLKDIFMGGAKGKAAELFLQNKQGKFISKATKVFLEDAASEDIDALFFDADSDHDLDLYVVSGGYEFEAADAALQDHLYLNDGHGNFSKTEKTLPELRTSGSCVREADVDNDGDLDLFVGGRITPGRYPEAPQSVILLNNGKGIFTDGTSEVAPLLKSIGMVTDAVWMDLNKDDHKDLVIVGEWMPITFLVNENGKLVDQSSAYLKGSSTGWWNCISAEDIDADGNTDLIVGNFGLNNQMKPTETRPVSLLYSDLDKNGSVDPIISYYIQDKSYPYPNRDELTDQVPSIKKKFTDYESYSEAQIENILTPEQINNSQKLAATHFETTILHNTGKGTFEFKELPIQAQFAPVFSILSSDINQDGFKDLILAGNLDKTRVRTGKYSGNFGFVFLGNGKGEYSFLPTLKSGISVKGDVRKIVQADGKIIFAVNSGKAKVYGNP